MSYSYSFDEETFHGECATVEDAIEEARDDAACIGEPVAGAVWIGENREPTEWITAFRLGDCIDGMLGDWLADEVGEAAENFTLTQDQRTTLGQRVLDFIAEQGGFRCWGVKNVQKYSLGQPDRDDKTIDMFEAGS